MKSITELKRERAIIIIIIGIIDIILLFNDNIGAFILLLLLLKIIDFIYDIRIQKTKDKMEYENYKNLKEINEKQ